MNTEKKISVERKKKTFTPNGSASSCQLNYSIKNLRVTPRGLICPFPTPVFKLRKQNHAKNKRSIQVQFSLNCYFSVTWILHPDIAFNYMHLPPPNPKFHSEHIQQVNLLLWTPLKTHELSLESLHLSTIRFKQLANSFAAV